MNIVVLCGGLCHERDVSIVSGRQIAAALVKRGHNVLLMDLYFGYRGDYTHPLELFDGSLEGVKDTLEAQAPDLESIRAQCPGADGLIGPGVFDLCRAADMVFMALHGDDGENGRLQAGFDLMGIRYTGSGYFGSALAMNKAVSRSLYQLAGIQVAPGQVVKPGDKPDNISYPCIVKPVSGGSSVGASVVSQPSELQSALDQAFKIEAEVLIEAFISGREFSVGVLAGMAFPVIEICPKDGFYNYENKYQSGKTDEHCPADLPGDVTSRLQAAALKAHQILHLDVYSRTDFMMDENGEIYCLETNTLPGMTPLSLIPQEAAAIGMDFGELCEKIIQASLEKYQ